MGRAVKERLYTPGEYLELERVSETKNEFYRGEIIPMPGASREHVLISGSISSQVHGQLRERSAEVYHSQMRLKVIDTGLYTYSDVVVTDAPILVDSELDTLLNPIVAFEVLSKSTEQYDRGDKFEHYRNIGSLTDYILVSQDRCLMEQFTRQTDGHWLYHTYTNMSDVSQIDSIECQLLLEDVYEKVTFAGRRALPR